MILTIYGLSYISKKIHKDKNGSKEKGKKSGRNSLDMAHTIDYVFGILLSQGTDMISLMEKIYFFSQSNHS